MPESARKPRRPSVEIECAVCHKRFIVAASDVDAGRKHCSRKCKGLARRNKTTAICEVCGSIYETWPSNLAAGRRHCSKKCSYISLSLEKQGDKNPAWRGGCRLSRGRNWSTQRKLALQRDGDVCQYCGKKNKPGKRKFQVHHIKPFRTFNGDYLAANQLSNLIVLCGLCHGKAETGKIAIQPKLL